MTFFPHRITKGEVWHIIPGARTDTVELQKKKNAEKYCVKYIQIFNTTYFPSTSAIFQVFLKKIKKLTD